ncbi:cell division protein FtsK [Enterococcus wangshanyuanii]|uniref:cell division protein FtsK n=2 Tax=Enterococcus wangshanyuanii TaxID=2005703 RepID=UPI000B4B51DF|nr:cell division protein FtsK [Enterococcus wangshanyuanii]
MLKKIFKYRGTRIRYSSRKLFLYYQLALFTPILALLGYFIGYKQIYPLVDAGTKEWQVYVLPVAIIFIVTVVSNILILLVKRISIVRDGYFARVEQRQILAKMVIDNTYYNKVQKKTSEGKTKEKIIFPKIYYRKRKETFEVAFETKGNKFQDKFLTIGGFLETALTADMIKKVDEKGFIVYELRANVYNKRISIREMVADKGKVQLMKGLYWYFDKDPHLLLGGGTGGGKTFTLLSLIYALVRVADIEICDPKRSDLMALGKLPLFEGKVHSGKDMVTCLKNAVSEMNERFEEMNTSSKYKMGKNYAYYGLKPKFIVIDEFAAWMAELSNDFKTAGEVEEYLTQIVLKARQCGIFLIVAMQRPDGEFIKTALRDNFMFRMSVGRLSETGNWMIFGDENKNKNFKFVEKVDGEVVYGRGYVAKGGDVASELYSPFVPDDFDFVEEFLKISDELGYERMAEAEVQKLSETIEKTFDREALSVESNGSEEKAFLDELSQKY